MDPSPPRKHTWGGLLLDILALSFSLAASFWKLCSPLFWNSASMSLLHIIYPRALTVQAVQLANLC